MTFAKGTKGKGGVQRGGSMVKNLLNLMGLLWNGFTHNARVGTHIQTVKC